METVEARFKLLMVAGLAGNAAAYERLLSASAQRLKSYFAIRLGADCADLEDLVQETLVAIHRRRASYDLALPFTAWLHAIARYKLIDYLRKRGLRKQVPLENSEAPAEPNDFDAGNAAADVERLLKMLPEKHRRSIELTHIEGYSVAETATITGQSTSGVKVSVHRGMKRLIARVRGGHDGN